VLAWAAPRAHAQGARPDTATAARAATDTTTRVTLGGFLDLFYAYDFGRPRTLDRAYVTTAPRHAEFNVNLAHLEAVVSGPRVRGRLALQFGTSVQANYANEPRVGALSGPDVARYVQEATIGLKVHPDVWLDAGVFFAPFGAESWVSHDNLTYTRSLIADFSPYYEAGVRAVWQATPSLQAQLHVINGWQNIAENNTDKAVGVRLDWTAAPGLVLSYDAFAGNEQPDSLPARLRQFHEVIAEWDPTPAFTLRLSLDGGREARAVGADAWWGGAAIARWRWAPGAALVARVEHFSDPTRVLATAAPAPFRVSAASIGVDRELGSGVQWRTELRLFRGTDAVFPDHDAPGGYATRTAAAVTALTWSF
jgi:hypothetical protein